MNDVEENPFIADEDDIIEAAPIDMRIDAVNELDNLSRYNRVTVWKGKAKIGILDQNLFSFFDFFKGMKLVEAKKEATNVTLSETPLPFN